MALVIHELFGLGSSEPKTQQPKNNLPEVRLSRSDGNKNLFPLADDKNLGNRNKLGGKPNWLQHDETPVCNCCHKKMPFYGQLDSYDDRHMIGDCGIIYVFYCFDCGTTKAITQSY